MLYVKKNDLNLDDLRHFILNRMMTNLSEKDSQTREILAHQIYCMKHKFIAIYVI